MDLDVIDVVARWLHLMSVVVWLGHNYANVIQNPLYRPVGPDPPLEELEERLETALKREHAIFRHASLVVLASGAFMLWHREILRDVMTLQAGHAVLGIGVWLGLIMVANLWFVLWPHQKRVLGLFPRRWRNGSNVRGSRSSPPAPTRYCRSPHFSSWRRERIAAFCSGE